MRILERLKGVKAAGFYTEEIRQGDRREGFRWKRLDGKEGILSGVDIKGRLRVGRYGVDVAGFERDVVPVLELNQGDVDVFVIDEIGKMECLSEKFVEAVRKLLAGDKPVVATIAIKSGGFISEAKKAAGIELLTITERNREAVVEQIMKKLSK